VLLAGDFTGWEQAALPMKKGKTGIWTKAATLAPGSYQYRLIVDGEWRTDPACNVRQSNPFGGENSVCVVQEPSQAAG
jgi:1,4-alpha-glucan branching enzyme